MLPAHGKPQRRPARRAPASPSGTCASSPRSTCSAPVWVSLRRRHPAAQRGRTASRPYLLTAGFTSGAFALFLAVTMRRRKRAAWILNLVLCGLFWRRLRAAPWLCPEIHAAPAELGLARADRRLPRRAAGRPAGVPRQGRPGQPLAGRRRRASAGCVLRRAGRHRCLVAVDRRPAAAPAFARTLSATRCCGWSRWPPTTPLRGDHHRPAGSTSSINVMSTLLFLLVLFVAFRSPRGRDLLSARGRGAAARRCSTGTASGTRSATSRCAATRASSGRRPARRRSPTGCVGGVTLASGDPIGDPEAWPGAIEAWLAEARQHAWVPAVMGASEEAGTVYARHGLDALETRRRGDRRAPPTSPWTAGRCGPSGRRTTGCERAGYTVRVRRHARHPGRGDGRAWCDAPTDWRDGGTERGFSMALGPARRPGGRRAA